MQYIFPPLVGFLISLLNLVCPILVPFALIFAKWDKEPSADSHGVGSICRGDLPSWLNWFSTPDERLPGGLYEPTVAEMYNKHGRFITSWYWLGTRNCLMGLSKAVGKQTTDYAPEDAGFWQRDDVWRYTIDFRLFFVVPARIILGYQVYKMADGQFWAYPCFTIKRP
jgi:hypothetical protein